MARKAPADEGDREEKRFWQRYERACRRFDHVRQQIDDAYEFCLPLRERSTDRSPGFPQSERRFDDTASAALQAFASRTLDDVWPASQTPFELRAGSEVREGDREEADRRLAEVTAEIIETINNSNFRAAAHEAALDYGISTGFLLPEQGDAIEPVRFRALPLTQARPDLGPFDSIDALFWEREVDAGQVEVVWPDATLPRELARMATAKPETKVAIVEGFERDWLVRRTETWRYRAMWKEKKATLVKRTRAGDGSQPFIAFSYSRVACEAHGRGPALIALSDIKTLNLSKQFILENADLAISGAWLYDDDGTINPDTIQIAPGSLIPRTPGQRGLDPLTSGADFQVADWLVRDLQQSIRDVFMQDELGRPDKTPFSAAEAQLRAAAAARKQAGPYARLLTEFLFPLVRAVAWLRKEQGAIRLPVIDGRAVAIRPLTPFTRQQATDDVTRHERWRMTLAQLVGPQLAAIISNDEALAEYLARKQGIDPAIVRTQLEREQLQQAIAQLAVEAAAPEAA